MFVYSPQRHNPVNDKKESNVPKYDEYGVSDKEGSKRIPLGLVFETNRGMLQTGAVRVAVPVKEKETKAPGSAHRSKSNFMKPTEAYR